MTQPQPDIDPPTPEIIAGADPATAPVAHPGQIGQTNHPSLLHAG